MIAPYPPPDKRLRPPISRVPAAPGKSGKALTPFGNFIATLAGQVSQALINNWISRLVNFGTRHTLSSKNNDAADWLRSQFRALGYADVIFHDFTFSGVTRHNVICTKPGSIDPSKYVIICAHYDSRMNDLSDFTSSAPGADDNASGVASLLEIARILFSIDTAYSIRFAAFSGEEQGLVGSTAYANFANSSGMQIPLLINLDMIGHPEDPANPTIVVEQDTGNVSSTNDVQSQSFAAQMVQAAIDYTAIKTMLGPIYSSDYMPFEAKNYICIGGFDGADSAPFYHTNNDTIDKVDMAFCAEVIRMVLATVLTAAGKKVGAALVFDPDPITTTGNTALTTVSPGLDAQRRAISLQGLDAADTSGNYHLNGTYCQILDIVAPNIAPPTTSDGVFVYSRNNVGFKDVMAYHHIDHLRRYVQTLGFSSIAPTPIQIDAHGNISSYNPITQNIVIATSSASAPDEAEDAGVILHEYGRAIQSTQNPGFTSTEGLGSGFGDLLPALYYDEKHANWFATRGMTAPWAGWGRRYDRAWKFDDAAIVGESARGEIWASTLFEIYRNLGGDSYWRGVRKFARDLEIKLHLKANPMVSASGATATQMAQQLEAADNNLAGWNSLANGLHRKVIYDGFQRRNLAGYPAKAVDVYIDDGRNGGYQWLENFWETQDIWVRTSPYANMAAQAVGGPGDHVEPPVNSIAYLYVRVKNRGTNAGGSGSVTVKAFHCIPGMGLVWPTAWTAMDTPSLNVTNVLPGPSNAVVVGPFPWTPTQVGHECLLVIVECANDKAVTQDLQATDLVPHSDLVPFDNNIAQRNIAPTMAKGKMVRGFYINNPFSEPKTITLHFDSSLPQGWQWHTNLPSVKEIPLGTRERRWVEIIIDQADGQEIIEFERPQRLAITGTIDDRVIGGMTFYIAPPSAFGQLAKPPVTEVTSLADLLNLNIPWKDCEVDGSIRVRFRFHKK